MNNIIIVKLKENLINDLDYAKTMFENNIITIGEDTGIILRTKNFDAWNNLNSEEYSQEQKLEIIKDSFSNTLEQGLAILLVKEIDLWANNHFEFQTESITNLYHKAINLKELTVEHVQDFMKSLQVVDKLIVGLLKLAQTNEITLNKKDEEVTNLKSETNTLKQELENLKQATNKSDSIEVANNTSTSDANLLNALKVLNNRVTTLETSVKNLDTTSSEQIQKYNAIYDFIRNKLLTEVVLKSELGKLIDEHRALKIATKKALDAEENLKKSEEQLNSDVTNNSRNDSSKKETVESRSFVEPLNEDEII